MRRIAMVRQGGGEDGIRRYRLARLDEIALASPPEAATTPPPEPLEEVQPESADAGEDDIDRRSRRAA